ncbi:RNA-binding protein [Brevundimonas sp. FT23028]|uniref:RNA-binding protein n=1 Tax=Brevundimonas sp. FT23028 TaxID=3393748 RepID=UPI003B587669
MTLEVFLDDTPGELRAVVERNGRAEHILMERAEDPAQTRLGARSVARVRQAAPGLKGVFLDLGAGLEAFMPVKGGESPPVGAKVVVEISAETREDKAPVARRLGPGEGEPRLLAAGPTLMERLARLAPGVEPVTGREAIEAGLRAIEAARTPATGPGVRIHVERTRAMITVDVDLNAHDMGRARPRDETNRLALREAARLIGLNRWGGLVAIDLIGAGHDGKAIESAARAAFAAAFAGGSVDPASIQYGPVNRFGVLMLSVPWSRTPLEEVLYADPAGRVPRPGQAAREAVRALRLALLSDTGRARVTLRAGTEVAALAAPWVAELGPRAHLKADDAMPRTDAVIETD